MSDTRSRTIVIRVRPVLHDLLKEQAAQEETTVSQVVRRILAKNYEQRPRVTRIHPAGSNLKT